MRREDSQTDPGRVASVRVGHRPYTAKADDMGPMAGKPDSTSPARSVEFIDPFGNLLVQLAVTSGMTSPVECAHCGRVYDLGAVTVTARYSDCSLWTTPCCGCLFDDRGNTGWTRRPHYRHLNGPTVVD